MSRVKSAEYNRSAGAQESLLGCKAINFLILLYCDTEFIFSFRYLWYDTIHLCATHYINESLYT